MKVIYIANKNEKGGAFYSLMEMVSILKSEYNVEPVVITQGEHLLTKFCMDRGIETHALGYDPFMLYNGSTAMRKAVKFALRPYYRLRRKKRLKSAIEKAEKEIDFSDAALIHTNVNRDDIGEELSRKYGIPHIWHIREFSDIDYDCVFLRKDAISYMNSVNGCFVAISDAIKQAWVRKGIEEKKICRIYNGIDISKFKNIAVRDFTKDYLRFIFTGEICETKGQIQVIKACAMLPQDIKDHIKVDFYGKGVKGYIDYLKSLVQSEGLEEVINFCGYTNEIQNVLPEYDCAFVCSHAEGFGRVTVEHMYCGLVVIASDSGANPELIDDEKDGFLYKSKDVNSLRDKIIQVYSNRDRLPEVSKKAKDKAERLYTNRINAKNVYQLYEEVIEKNGKTKN